MADYDSDSSGAEDVQTSVLLGYASKEPTSDEFSQLGGHPTWLDDKKAPSGALATCKVCNSLMNLLLQLHGDIPERFPGHERRLYLWACKRKACRRKAGGIRGFRAVRVFEAVASTESQASSGAAEPKPAKSQVNIGEALFGVKSPSATQTNPFASAQSLTAKPAQQPPSLEGLTETFAQKARISSSSIHQHKKATAPQEPWPELSQFPIPYKSYHLDADTEYLDPESNSVPANARLDRSANSGEGSSTADDKAAFESSMDRTFQRFADRLAQNPEQVLRYEFDGQPLLYSKVDAIGKLLSPALEQANAKVQLASNGRDQLGIPRCANCGAARVFELQLTPHAITELEADDMDIDGMDWGTILLGVCSADCQGSESKVDDIGYVEEWVGVQWEEVAEKRRP